MDEIAPKKTTKLLKRKKLKYEQNDKSRELTFQER